MSKQPSRIDATDRLYPPPRLAAIMLCVVTFAYILSFIDRQVLSLLVEPLKHDLAITDVQVSFLQGLAFASIYCVSGIAFGRAADQYSRRNIIIVGVLLWSTMTTLCGTAGSYGLLLICRAGVGIGEAALSPSAYSLLSDYFAPRRLPVAMSLYNLGPAIGSGLAYLVGGVLLSLSVATLPAPVGLFLSGFRPWQVTFILVGSLGAVVAVLMLAVKEPPRIQHSEDASLPISFGETARYLFARRGTLGMFIAGVALFWILSYATMTWYPPMFARSFAEPANRVGLIYGPLYTVSSIAGIIGGGWAGGKMADSGYDFPFIRWTLVVVVAALIASSITPLLPSLKLSYAVAAVLILLQNAWFGTALAAVHLAVPNRMRAQVTAIVLFSTNILGLILGPTAVATITEHVFHDQQSLRFALAIVSAISGLAAWLVLYSSLLNFRRVKPDQSYSVARI